jgi:hypothetical protein
VAFTSSVDRTFSRAKASAPPLPPKLILDSGVSLVTVGKTMSGPLQALLAKLLNTLPLTWSTYAPEPDLVVELLITHSVPVGILPGRVLSGLYLLSTLLLRWGGRRGCREGTTHVRRTPRRTAVAECDDLAGLASIR